MRRIIRFPVATIVVIALLTIFFAAMLPRTQLDNDVMAFIPQEHPSREAFDRLDELYGTDLSIVVAVYNPRESILTPRGVALVRDLTTRLEQVEHVSSVESLASIEYIDGDEEGMRVEELAAGFDGSSASVREIRRRLRSWEAYDGALVSDDLRGAQFAVAVPPDLEADLREGVYFAILDVISEFEAAYPGAGYEYHVAGEPAITVLLSRNMQADITTLIPLVVVVVLVSLLIFFRRLGGVILPMITVLVSTVWTIGLMALLGIKLSIVATVIPVLMVAVGSAYGIHIVNHFYDEAARTGVPDRATRERLVVRTLERVGIPVLMAGLTTIVGFGALATSEVTPMRDFGIFTAIGVAVALLVALTLIPALLVLVPSREKGGRRTVSEDAADRGSLAVATGAVASRGEAARGSGAPDPTTPRGYLITLYRFFGRRKQRILIAVIVLTGIFAWGSTRLIVDNELIAYFKRDTEISIADAFLREHFLGTRSFDINVSGTQPGDLTRPEILTAMDRLATHLEGYPEVSQVLSYTDFIKRMNQMMNIGVPSPDARPDATFPDMGAEASSPAGAGAARATSEGGASPAPDAEADTGGWSSFGEGGFSADEGFSADGGFGGGFSTGEGGGDLFGSALAAGTEDAVDAADPAASAPASSTGAGPAAMSGENPDSGASSISRILTDALAMADRTDISAAELVRLINRQTNFEGAAFYEIPADPSRYPVGTEQELANLISQYLLLYSGSLDSWADEALEPMQARMSVQLRTTGNLFTRRIVREIEEYVATTFPEGYEVEIAGVAIVEMALTDLITRAQIVSIIVSLSLVFLIVALTYRSLVAGIYGVIPLALTLVVNFGVMGFFGIKLDISTAMVASIAIGIGIDYTIHFLSAYHAERRESSDLEQVELNVLTGTGKAITFNALSVAAGFAVLTLSTFNPLIYMGILIALTMLTSSLASMTVLPVLLDVFKPRFMEPRKGEQV
jgi:predicted RND superfamily exporter protein